jgi:hypothetical protein
MRIAARRAGGIAAYTSHHLPLFLSIGFISQPLSGIVGFLRNSFVDFSELYSKVKCRHNIQNYVKCGGHMKLWGVKVDKIVQCDHDYDGQNHTKVTQ